MSKTQVNLYVNHANDLQFILSHALANEYNSITTPLVNPLFSREFSNKSIAAKHIPFSRSDLIFKSTQWLNGIVCKFSDYIDCDSESDQVRKHSEETLQQEVAFAEHVVQNGYCLMRLRKGRCNVNLGRILSSFSKCYVLLEVPMACPKSQSRIWRSDLKEKLDKEDDPWNWWNSFRIHSDFHSKHRLALVLSADIPEKEEILRWLGEPVEFLIIPTSLFIRNASNYPILSKAHQEIVGQFVRKNVHFMVQANVEESNLNFYAEYLKHLASKYFQVDIMTGFDELLEIPLQPLFDNLDSYTYEVFEKDPVKYIYYQRAIEGALVDKIPELESLTREIVIMIVGAGRGPLIRATLNALENTKRKGKILVVEKNQNAINTLAALVTELWPKKPIKVLQNDMRELELKEKVDIMVSELLGSFGDNELSPECLYGAQRLLKPDGISIPSKYTSYIEPIMSSKLLNQVRTVQKSSFLTNVEKAQNYLPQFEYTYVVYMKNVYHIDEPKDLFTFVHPLKTPGEKLDNSRFKTLKFKAKIDTIFNGFAGYFDTVLYKDVTLSTHPIVHTRGLASWFSMFIPITTPVSLKAGEEIEVNFWRRVGPRKVWYEWSVTQPTVTHVHNLNGRACDILM